MFIFKRINFFCFFIKCFVDRDREQEQDREQEREQDREFKS
jgi:hypothetical protein